MNSKFINHVFLRWLGLDEAETVPKTCKSVFEILCGRMEEKLTFGPDEQVAPATLLFKTIRSIDMVI